MTRAGERLPVVLLATTKVAVSLVVLGAGFVALSDDDFSRVVIAERFASHLVFDPSGTSWLPLPFWLTGGAMTVFGRTLDVARVVAVLLGVAATLLIYWAARRVGASRASAFLGTVVATVMPTAARLGVSFQPEAFTAGLIVFGALATLMDGPARIAGGLALGAACLCRYEAWPAAVLFAFICVWDAVRRRPSNDTPSSASSVASLAAAAGLALAPSIAWVVHGAATHHDALFFLHRVTAYRRALGETETVSASLLAYPVALVRAEPELTLTSLVLIVGAFAAAHNPFRRLAPPTLVLGGLLGFLVLGRLMGGAPTHHDERTLLPVWTGIALLGAEIAVRAIRGARVRRATVAVVGALLVVASVGIRVTGPSESFAPRTAERAIGDAARASLGAGDQLMIDTPDYGYFAVIAAFGAPERAEPFDRHDPREPRSTDAFASARALGERLAGTGATWFVATRKHLPTAAAFGDPATADADFTLFHVKKSEPVRALR